MDTKRAEFSISHNDMYWTIFDLDDKAIRWTGYNDDFWWDKVSVSDQFQVQRGPQTGKVYRLDPRTQIVTIEQQPATAPASDGEQEGAGDV